MTRSAIHIHVPSKKYAYQSLKLVYGINNHTIYKLISILGLKPNSLNINLTKKNLINKLNDILPLMRIDFKLRLITFSRIVLLIYNQTYRGMRHIQGLPTRGQRTHANAKTPKKLKSLGKHLPFKLKRKLPVEVSKQSSKKALKQKKKIKLSKKKKGKLKTKQKVLKKNKK